MTEEPSIDERIAAAQAEIDRTDSAQTGHRGVMGNLLKKIGHLARPALGLGNASAEKQLQAAEQEAALPQRVKDSAVAAIGVHETGVQADIAQAEAHRREAALRENEARFALAQATATLNGLQAQRSSVIHQQHAEAFEDAKTRLARTAVDVEVLTESLSKVMYKFRDNIREVRVCAIKAGISIFPYERAQAFGEDWVRDRLFNTTTRVPRHLVKPLGEIISEFLAHKNIEVDAGQEKNKVA